MLAEELEKAFGQVLMQQPITLRAMTEGQQNLGQLQGAALESVVAARDALFAAARMWDSLSSEQYE